jgi:hypothetical protein
VPTGKEIWHLDVNRRGGRFDAFFDLCDVGTSGDNGVLYFATSTDGLAWTLGASALLGKSLSGWDNQTIYRASGVPTATGYDLFYSAYNTSVVWKIGRTAVTLS